MLNELAFKRRLEFMACLWRRRSGELLDWRVWSSIGERNLCDRFVVDAICWDFVSFTTAVYWLFV